MGGGEVENPRKLSNVINGSPQYAAYCGQFFSLKNPLQIIGIECKKTKRLAVKRQSFIRRSSCLAFF